DPAFATLGRIFGVGARPAITTLTLAGGFASTVSWPATHFLIDAVGWRDTYLAYAALLAFVVAPLAAFALPRSRAEAQRPRGRAARPRPARGRRCLRPGCHRLCGLCVRAVGARRPPAGDIPSRRPRWRHRGGDRGPVRARAGRRAPHRVPARAQHPPPGDRAL